MKSRLTLIFAALVVLLGAMVWVVEDRARVIDAGAPVAAPVPLVAFAPLVEPEPSSTSHRPAAGPTVLTAAPAPVAPTVERDAVSALPPQGTSTPIVRVDASGDVTYVARTGDTVSELASALLGSASKEHRDAVVRENVSLQADPDRVLAGEQYSVDPSPARAAGDDGQQPNVAPVAPAPARASASKASATSNHSGAGETAAAAAPGGRKMTYLARVGDTVRVLAANLLGGDTKANRDAIIAGNASLRQDPDHMVAGRSYTIIARDGLATDPDAPQPASPAAQPDADDVVQLGVGRSLRYTARPGDTVAKLAAALLGGDTLANRESIIRDNPTLKDDPDHLVAGQTYWVTAPMAE